MQPMKKMAKIQSWLFIKRDSQIPIFRSVAYTSWVAFQCNFATQCNPYRKLRLLPAKRQAKACLLAFCGFERRLLAAVRGTAATAVAFPQKSESTFPRQKSTGLDRDLSFFTYSLFIIHLSLFILLQVFALLFSFALNIMYTSRHLNQRSDTHEIHYQGGL